MTLATHTLGAPESSLPPVVLVHGFASSAAEDYVATGWGEALAAAGRTGIAIDLPGHGDSAAVSSVDAARTTAVVASILDAIAASFPEGDVDVIGYSLGGRLSWELPAASPRVRRVVLGGVSPFEPFGMIAPAELAAVLGGAEPTNPMIGMMAGMISAPGRDTQSLAKLIEGLGSEPFAPRRAAPRCPPCSLLAPRIR